jgi:hypothetical protein
MKLKTVKVPSIDEWRTAIGEPIEPEDWVLNCTSAAVDQQRANGSPEQCRVAFLANLPMLISRRHVRGYIACVAAGIPLKIITPHEANQLLYLAQTALSAWKDGAR